MSTAGDREAELTAIGREMFAWLDDAGWASNSADGAGDRELKVRVRRTHDVREIALLEVLWELLARDNGPLALDTLHLFTVARRVSASADAWKPHHGDLQLMFMASAPKGQVELYFEWEEAAILAATRGNGRVHLVVAETGALRFLGGRLTSRRARSRPCTCRTMATSTTTGARCSCSRQPSAAPSGQELELLCRRLVPRHRRSWCSRPTVRLRPVDRWPRRTVLADAMRPRDSAGKVPVRRLPRRLPGS
jgi:hypothetical protein